MNRRDLLHLLPAAALLPALSTSMEAQQGAALPQKAYKPGHCEEPMLTACEAFPYEALPIRYSDSGAPTRQILEGRIPATPNPAGNVIELHETTLAPGKMPHAAHRHPHAELLLVRTGTIEFLSDAAPVRVTAGGAAYCAPNQLHGFRNVSDGEAQYFILKIGAEPVCQK